MTEKKTNKITGRIQKRTRGSLTIEAAMIMGIILFAIISTLEVSRTVYNRVILTANAYENAITGREKTAAGLWGSSDESILVDWLEMQPVSFLRKIQMLKGE